MCCGMFSPAARLTSGSHSFGSFCLVSFVFEESVERDSKGQWTEKCPSVALEFFVLTLWDAIIRKLWSVEANFGSSLAQGGLGLVC